MTRPFQALSVAFLALLVLAGCSGPSETVTSLLSANRSLQEAKRDAASMNRHLDRASTEVGEAKIAATADSRLVASLTGRNGQLEAELVRLQEQHRLDLDWWVYRWARGIYHAAVWLVAIIFIYGVTSILLYVFGGGVWFKVGEKLLDIAGPLWWAADKLRKIKGGK